MEKSSARLKVFAILVLVMFAALSTRLWFLQVLATQVYAEEAQNNGVRSVAIDALRGQIWTEDQYGKPNGKPLVQNRSSLEVRVDKQELEESGVAEQVLGELSAMLDIPVKQIRRDLESKLYFDYQPKPVAEFVDEEVAFAIRERQEDFPGVQVRNASVREYPMGRTASHMVGWVGQVQAAQLEQDEFPICDGSGPSARCYGPNDMAGQTGLEVQYEKWLRGRKGFQRYVVNSDGERIRDLGGQQPTPGGDLVLTIDSEWQRAAEEYLEESILRTRQVLDEDSGTYFKADAGVVVVLDVETGGLKAMASWPDYDPRWFVRGPEARRGLLPGPHGEVLGRRQGGAAAQPRISGGLPAGLDVQAVHGSRGGEGGLRGSRHGLRLPVRVRPSGGTSRRPRSRTGRRQDLFRGTIAEHLIISCDSSFYEWGSDFWFRYQNDQLGEDNEPLQKHLRAWGFEKPTGVDLPGEASGFLPDAEWGNAARAEGPVRSRRLEPGRATSSR